MLEEKLIVELDTSHVRRKYYQLTEKGRGIFSNELQRYNEAVELAKKKNVFVFPVVKRLALTYA